MNIIRTKYHPLFPILAVALCLASCAKEIDPAEELKEIDPAEELSYSDMQITEFSYSDIPAAGGKITPTIAYKYKVTDGNGKTEEKTSGATLTFGCPDNRYTVDKATGEIVAASNETIDEISFEVVVTAAIETTSSNKTITVRQAAAEEGIISTKTIQLPITLATHKCVYRVYGTNEEYWNFDTSEEYAYITTRNDGKCDRDFMDQVKPESGVKTSIKVGITPEYVSTRGIDIQINGGDLANINTYRSGKIDTVIVSKAEFKTSTKYTFVTEQFLNDGKYENTSDDPSQAPKCSYANGIWSIAKMGFGRYTDISHTLTATVNGQTTSITINQNNNYVSGKLPEYIIFKEHGLTVSRDSWPNFEDYPVGCSSPKWDKPDGESYRAYEDTKDLHPDGNRYVEFYFTSSFDRMQGRNVYISGAVSEFRLNQHHVYEDRSTWLRGGVIITATANVKLKDGSTKTVTHKSEWLQPTTAEESTHKYRGRGYTDMLCFSFYVPVVENAAEDFEWTFKFQFILTADNYFWGDNVKEQTNYFDYNWAFKDFTFKDCLYTVKEYRDAKNLSGFFDGQDKHPAYQGDIIDGIEQTY